jgi:toxin YoeB
MGKFRIEVDKRAQLDFEKIYKSGNSALIRKMEVIVEELSNNPFYGTGKPEPLKYNLSRFWSRRLNKKDRIIYQVIEEPDKTVVIISALGHY